MKQRIQKYYGDILTAFLLMDKNRDGVINRGDFRILFDSLEFTSNEEEYQRVLGMLGLEPGATLNYAEFFDAIQATGKPGIQLLSANKWKRFVEEAGEQVHSHLASRAHSGWSEMAKSFSHFNEEGQGLVTKRDLKQLLYTYALPISPNQFEKLWSRYDREGRGELTHSEFLEQLGVAPEENGRGQSHMTMEGCSGSQTQGRAGSAGSQTAQTSPVLQEIREVVRRSYAEVSCSLVGLDESKDGYVGLDDLQALLQKHGSQVKEDELIHLLNSLKISVDNRKLSYLHFLQAFGHRAASAPGSRPPRESVEQLSPDRAMLRLREEVSASYHALHKVFSAFDKSGRGAVSPLEFQRVLDHFCVRLSDRQLTHLLSMLPVNEDDHSVPWRHFLLKFRIKDQAYSTENWLERVERAVGPAKPRPLPMSDILERIQEVVSAKLYTVAKDMAELDYGRINVISKEHFRVICDRHFLRVTDEQFESLWELLPVNEFGNLEYRELLKRFSGDSWGGPQTSERGDPVTSPVCPEVSTSAIRRPKTAPCIIGRPKSANQGEETGPASVTGGGASPPLSADAVERRVRGQTRGCWKELQRRCREEDPTGCGGIATDSFLGHTAGPAGEAVAGGPAAAGGEARHRGERQDRVPRVPAADRPLPAAPPPHRLPPAQSAPTPHPDEGGGSEWAVCRLHAPAAGSGPEILEAHEAKLHCL
ncbi:hypothetical protein AGOR_G00231180 [Albula goreensis]|uniref:EF-hand domain-containing protein n=1 Tax=Albula goreensis TaxID=1534307 RepID=A0A8T3CEL6_9TELE|nr:hypothetical protein AGOR_G00231180 [Albula goreensis]